MILTITEEMKEKIEHWWKKPISELTDVDAITIVEEFVDVDNVKDAWFSTEDEIYYTLEEEEEPEDDDIAPAWTEEYLNTLGMNKSDF